MKTVFIFPGLNGLIKSEDRFRYLHIPEVQNRLNQVEQLFLSQENISFKFTEYFQGTVQEIYSVQNISRAATAICAIQVGIAEHLIAKGIIPDWTLGCSLGDLARSVTSEVCSFEVCIAGYIRFAKKLQGIERLGANIGVSKPAGAAFTKDEIQQIEELQLDVSVMTPKFLNIGGRNAELQILEKAAIEKGWRVGKILDYPAHSRYILPYVEAAILEIQDLTLNAPKHRAFSCISCKELTDTAEIKNELLLNMTHALKWGEAVQNLEKIESDLRFVNIGPCKSLSKMHPDLNLRSHLVEVEDL